MKLYIGIDPGTHGGIAVIREHGERRLIECYPLSRMGDNDVFIILKEYARAKTKLGGSLSVALEAVRGYQGKEHPGSRMFAFGEAYGAVRAIATVALGMIPVLVDPQTWQKALGIKPRDKKRGESDASFKGRIKARAKELFPDVEGITLATADALLIVYYHYLTLERLPTPASKRKTDTKVVEKS